MAPLLGYWNVRGLGQPIRLMMEYIGMEYEQTFYQMGPAPDFDKSDWLDVKFNLGLAFPNLPYYIDGDVMITQTIAILKYLAMKNPDLHLLGDTDEEKLRADMMYAQATDLVWAFVMVAYSPDYENLKGGWIESLPKRLQEVEDFIGERKFTAGDKVTYGDFLLYEFIDWQLLYKPDCLDTRPVLKGFQERFANMDNIAAYLKSDRCMTRPVFNVIAKWGNE